MAAGDFAAMAVPWLQATAESLPEFAAVIDGNDYAVPGQQSLLFSDVTDILTPIFTEITERVETGEQGQADAPVSSVAASLHPLIATSRDVGADAGALEAFARIVEKAVADGYGAQEISVLAA